MRSRVYSYGQHTYRVGRTFVDRWDPITNSWRLVGATRSRRQARFLAARDAYRRQVNP